MSFLTDNLLGILVAVVVVFIVVKLRKRMNYFSDKGLAFVKPTWWDLARFWSPDAFNNMPIEAYDKCRGMNTPYVGFFNSMLTPSLLVLDPSMAEKVFIKDFSYFQDHGFDVDPERNPLMAWQLFNLKGDEWRTLRHKLVPTFTSGKLRGMVPIMEECADSLIREINQDQSLKTDTSLKDIFKRYSLSVIVSCAFGIDPESIKDPNCYFRKVMALIVTPSFFSNMKFMMAVFCPKLMRLLRLRLFPKEVDDFMVTLTKQTFEMRKKPGVKRNDFMQLLFELKEKGSVELDIKDLEQDEKESLDKMRIEPTNTKLDLTEELIMAQAFVFLIGGFENTAFLVAINQHLLSKHPEVQAKAREEVKQMRDKHGKLDYEALRDMKFLGACIDEALRLYSPAILIMREVNRSYTLDDGKKVDKGLPVLIPAKAFHMDERYWTKPEVYNPERFLNGEPNRSCTYIPFGDGPRMCIAQRMALLFAKLMLAKLLLNFELLPSSKTKEPLKLKVLFVPDFEGGLYGTLRDLDK